MDVIKVAIPDTRERMLEDYQSYMQGTAERVEEHLKSIGRMWQVKYPKRELSFYHDLNIPYWGIDGRSLDYYTVHVPSLGQCVMSDEPNLKAIYEPLLEALNWYAKFSSLVGCRVSFTLPAGGITYTYADLVSASAKLYYGGM